MAFTVLMFGLKSTFSSCATVEFEYVCLEMPRNAKWGFDDITNVCNTHHSDVLGLVNFARKMSESCCCYQGQCRRYVSPLL